MERHLAPGTPPAGHDHGYRHQHQLQHLHQEHQHAQQYRAEHPHGSAVDEPLPNDVLHGTVKKCLRIFSGRANCTPTASLPDTTDMGLLMFLNMKQAHLNQATRGIDLYRYPVLKPLLSIIEFINYVVGGLIVEAEKVDEMHLAIKKEMVKREARIDYYNYDHTLRRKGEGSQLAQILAVHFPSKKHFTSVRSGRIKRVSDMTDSGEQLSKEDMSVEEDRWVLAQLKTHVRSASSCRTLLHGRVPGGMDPNLANAAVMELSIPQAFRKAMHKVRDALNEVEDQNSLPAVQTLSQFLDYLHYGVSVALDELESCELLLRKKFIGTNADRRIQALEMKDKENKRASCCALRFNSIVNSPKKSVHAHSHSQRRVFSARPDSTNGPPPHPTPGSAWGGYPQGPQSSHPSMPPAHHAMPHVATPSDPPSVPMPHAAPQMSRPPSTHQVPPPQHPVSAPYVPQPHADEVSSTLSERNRDVEMMNTDDCFLDAYCCE